MGATCSCVSDLAQDNRGVSNVVRKAEVLTGKDIDGDGKVAAAPAVSHTAASEDGQRGEEMDDGLNIPTSKCDGNKKSLFIGINYFGSSAELRGCINDVKNIKDFVVTNFHFPKDDEHMLTLTDDLDADHQPTRKNMENAFRWLVEGAKSGDSLFFHYSGHGGSQADRDPNTDEADAKDETLVPVDYEKAGMIVDDDVHAMLVATLPEGVRLTAVMDCCHSGSVFDLPYSYGMDANARVVEQDNRKLAMQAAMAAGMSLIHGDKKAAMAKGMEAVQLFRTGGGSGAAAGGAAGGGGPAVPGSQTTAGAMKIRSTLADVIQFSGCRDEQTSADANISGQACGAMSWALIKSFKDHGNDQEYTELLGHVRENLMGKFQQVPQMSTGHRMALEELKFIM